MSWRRSTGWWLLAVVLVALNLRTPLASVPPVADAISADLGLNATGTGLLTTLPVVCMGLFAPVAALASRRFDREPVLAASVALIAVGTALRAIPYPVPLFVGTAVAGVGIAVAGALLPPLVRGRFAHRVGPVTGLYTAGLIGGAMLAAALTEPIRVAVGGAWSTALAVWAVPAAAAVALWLTVAAPRATAAGSGAAWSGGPVPGRPWRDRANWWATLFMGGQSLLYYGALAWLAARYTAIGFDPAEAGLLLGVFSATQIVSALGLPVLAHRTGALPASVAVSVGTSTAMLAAIALAPAVAPWLWAALLGLGAGGMFALALTVLGSLGRSPAEAAAASGLAFFVGYLLASLGPVAAGALRDLTGGYRVPFLALAAVGVAVLVAGVAAARSVVRVSAPPLVGSTVGMTITWKPHTVHGELDADARNKLPDSAFAFPDKRKEPLTDASHVQNALARFDQVKDVSDQERDQAFTNICAAANHYGVDVAEDNWRQLGKRPHTQNPAH